MNLHRLRSILQLLCLSVLLLPPLLAQTPNPYTDSEDRATDYTLTGSNNLSIGSTPSDWDDIAIQSGILSGDGSVTKTGYGTLVLTGANTYTGGTTITGGDLQIGNGGTFGSLLGNITNNNQLVFNRSDLITFAGIVTGGGTLNQEGTGTLVLTGANTYTGQTIVTNGTLQLGGNSVLGSNSYHVGVSAGATFDLNGYSQSTGGIAGSGNIIIGGSGTFSVGSNNNNNTFSGVISGTGDLTKTGSGILTLSGANTHSGTTTISSGTITLGASNVLSDSTALDIAAGATLDLDTRSDTIGSLTGSGNVVLDGSGTLTTGANDTSTTFGGVISGFGGLTKTGTGTFILTGTNTYSGVTTISGGTLQFNEGNPTGHITNNGTLIFNRSAAATYAGNISGSGSVTKSGAESLTLSGFHTYTGYTTISAGTLLIGANERIANTSAVTVASGATFNLNGYSETIGSLAGDGSAIIGSGTLTAGDDGTSTTFGGVLSGTGNLTKAGAGTFTLTGANTYSGATTVNAGVLNIQSNAALGSSAAGTTIASGAALEVQNNITVTGETLTLNGSGVSSNGALRNISDNNTMTGDVTLASASEIQNDAGTLTISGGVTSSNHALTLDGSGNTTLSGVVALGSGSLTKTGSGTATLSGANTYSGSTTVNAGTLSLGATGSLGTTNALSVASGATFDLNGRTQTVGSLSGDGSVALGSGTLTAGSNGSSTTYSGVLSGTGGFTKAGSGTLTLSGDNTYTGGTTIQGGEVILGAHGTTGSVLGDITLDAGTAINFQRSNAVTFTGNISYNGTGAGGDRDGAVDISVSGTSFTLDGDIDAGAFYFTHGGTLNLAAGATITTVNAIQIGSDTADTTINLANGASFSGSVYIGDISATSNTARTTTLNILANATVDLSDSYVALGGYEASGTAELNLGAGATLTMKMVDSFFGGNGHESSAADGSDATVNLSAGSTLHLDNTYDMHIGGAASAYGNGGNAIINVNNATLTLEDPRFTIGGMGDATYHGGDATLNLTGSGTTLDLSVNSYLAYQPTTIGVGGNESNGGTGTLNVTNGATLIVNEISVGDGSGGGSGTLTVSGTGSTLTLSKHSGGSYGSLHIGGSADSSDSLNGANGTVTITDHATASVANRIQIGGDGSNDPSSYTGGTGTLTVSDHASLTVQGNLIVGGSPQESSAGNATLNVNTGATLNFQQTLHIGGESGEGATGAGTLNLGAATLAGNGNGTLVISPTGTLNLGYDGAAATAAPTLTLGGEYLENYGTLNLRHSSGTFTLAAPIDGDGTLNQTGAGATVLTGDNSSFTGATTVSAGKLTVQGAYASPVTVQSGGTFFIGSTGTLSGALTLDNGAQFDNNGTYAVALTLGADRTLGGSGTFSNLVTVASGGTLSPGNSPGTLTFANGLTLDSGAIIDLELGSISDLLRVSGGALTGPSSGLVTLNLTDSGGFGAGTYTLINYTGATTSSFDLADFTLGSTIAGYTYSLGISGSSLQLTATAVPEPSTYAILFSALVLGFVAYRRRRKA